MTENSNSSASTHTDAPHTGLGIDIGGSGIKGAIVDLDSGEFVGDRVKIATPKPATPDAVAKTVKAVIDALAWDGPVGITMPSVVKEQTIRSAANIDKSWIGIDATELFGRHLDHPDFTVINDADAAGLAEITFGDDRAKAGSVIFLTLGTGIGSAMVLDGNLFPNTELGHMLVGKKEAEHIASSAVREREDLSYKKWAKRLDKVLAHYAALLNPDIFIIGGGISRKFEKWGDYLTIDTPVAPAQLRNRAGIVGAAMAVNQSIRP